MISSVSGLLGERAHMRRARSRCLRCCPRVAVIPLSRPSHRARGGHGPVRRPCESGVCLEGCPSAWLSAWHCLVAKVVLPAVLAPVIAVLVAATGTWLLYRISRGLTSGGRNHGFRIGQIGSASMVSLAHGTNDAQKTMGVITLALIANGTLPANATAPFWVSLTCALAISLGTYVGGWRVIRTLGKGLVKIESPQGMAAQSSSAAVILLSASFGYALSTTHYATGSIIGAGLGTMGTQVRWNVAGRTVSAWALTLPAAGIVGAAAYGLASAIGGSAGVIVDLLVLVAVSAVIYARSRAFKVNHTNVNDEWTGPGTPAEPQPIAVA